MNVNKTFSKSIRFDATILSLMIYIIGLFCMPSGLLAGEIATTVDTKTIHYPSMFVGQVWVKSGEPLSPAQEGGERRVVTGNEKNVSSNLKTDPDGTAARVDKNLPPAVPPSSADIKKESASDAETIKKLRQRRLKTLQALEKRKANKTASDAASIPAFGKEEEKTSEGKIQKTASNPALSVPVAGAEKAKKKASEGKTRQLKMTAPARATDTAISGIGSLGKKWHSKQDLYDVECGQRLARVVATYHFDRNGTIVGSKIFSDDQWYHIYPGSLEEKLFIEVCHPTIPTVRR